MQRRLSTPHYVLDSLQLRDRSDEPLRHKRWWKKRSPPESSRPNQRDQELDDQRDVLKDELTVGGQRDLVSVASGADKGMIHRFVDRNVYLQRLFPEVSLFTKPKEAPLTRR